MQDTKPKIQIAAWLIGFLLLAACTPRPLTQPSTPSPSLTLVPPTATSTSRPAPTSTPSPGPTAMPTQAPTTSDTSAAIVQGEAVFKRLACNACHGQQGGGSIGPTLAQSQLELDQMIDQMRSPVGNIMPKYSADQVSDEEIAAVYAYMQSLPLPDTIVPSVLLAVSPTVEPATATPMPTPTPMPATPAPTTSDTSVAITRGEAIFKRLGCNACHGQKGEGSIGPTLAQSQLELSRFISQLQDPYGSIMPKFAPDQVSDDEIGDIYAFVQSLPMPENVVPSVLMSVTPSVITPGAIRGTVYYEGDGNHPAEEELFIVPAEREGNAVRYLFTTAHLPAAQANEQGEFVFEQVEPGTYALFYTYSEAEVVDASGEVIIVDVAVGETAIIEDGFIPPR